MKYLNCGDKIKSKVIALTLPVVDYIPDSEGLISYCARVSNEGNQLSFDTAEGLLKFCIRNAHWSIFEMSNVVVEIKVPRDISRQVLRHRTACFQEFCISKDSLITTDTGRVSIEDLFKYQAVGTVSTPKAKVYDEGTKEFVFKDIKEVFNTGLKGVYEITLKNGSTLKGTKDHKILTKSGFKIIGDLVVGTKVGTNGIPCHQNKDWLCERKKESILNGGGLKFIADSAGVSYHTIRKWLKVHSLSFTKKEVASYTPVWNKGLNSELQPNYGNTHSEATRVKMSDSSLRGSDSNLWKGGVTRSERQAIWDWQHKYKNKLLKESNSECSACRSTSDLEIDHILPVKSFPEDAYNYDNLQILCSTCHKEKTRTERKSSPNYSEIVSIVYIGEEQTYDLEVDHKSHNYVANGIVTHNSQRYAEVSEDMFCIRETRMQDTKDRQNSTICDDSGLDQWWHNAQENHITNSKELYELALSRGLAKEVARVVLPEGNTMSTLYMNANMRTWLHYLKVRSGNGTQKEHIWLTDSIRKAMIEYMPTLLGMIKDTK